MSRRAWSLFALMSLLWGLPYLFIKMAVAEVPVPVVVCARGLVGAAVLLPFVVRGRHGPVLRRRWRPILLLALLEMIGPWALLAHAETTLNSSTTSLLIATTPLVAAAITAATPGGNRLPPVRLLGLATGFGGVAVLAGPGFGGDGVAIAEVLLTALCYTLATLMLTRWLADVPGIPLTTACLGVTGIAALPAAMLTAPRALPSTDALAALLALATICTAVAFATYFALVREAGPDRTLVVTFVSPGVAVVAGALVLNESVGASTFLALGLIIGGSFLATRTTSNEDLRDCHVHPALGAAD